MRIVPTGNGVGTAKLKIQFTNIGADEESVVEDTVTWDEGWVDP